MYTNTIPEADREQMLAALKAWKAAGNDSPMIPLDVDVDGDGTADAIGLDDDGNLVILSGVALEETTYEADETEVG